MNSIAIKSKAFRNFAIIGMLISADQGMLSNANLVTFTELPTIDVKIQLEHAIELMEPQRYAKVLTAEPGQDQRAIILDLVKSALPVDQKAYAMEISAAVINEANRYEMDPFFLLSIISHESRFDRKVRGSHGEIGLMQILPSTAKWVAKRNGMNTDVNLEDPSINIHLGTAYLAHLRKSFKRQGNRYVAAYNMGSRNVRRLLASETEPTVYPDKVMTIYNNYYNLLSRLNVRPYQQTASN